MSDPITEQRLALQASGFSPIPVLGKKALLPGWSRKVGITAAEIASWAVGKFSSHQNTGILTSYTPALDIDINRQDVAEAVSDAIRDWFDDRGTLLVRFGRASRRAVLFRTEQPFGKIRIEFIDPTDPDNTNDPDKKAPAIEVLGDGQQIVVAGVHPGTKLPYSWHAGRTPANTPRSDLPEITEKEAGDLVKYISDMLWEKFGFKIALNTSNNGDDTGAAGDAGAGVDVDKELAGIAYGNINDTWSRVMGSLLRKGVAADDILYKILTATQNSAACQADPKKKDWGKSLANMMTRYMRDEREFVLNLSPEMQIRWHQVGDTGEKPQLTWRHDLGKFGLLYVRKPKCTGGPPLDEESRPSEDPPKDDTAQGAPAGWNLYDGSKVAQPEWFIKGLLPKSGVAIIPGQWGGYKTTTALAIALAGMTGQPFADHYRVKRMGAVIYFALEGAGTLGSRLATLAKEAGAPDKLPFAWRDNCPLLTAKDAGPAIVAQCGPVSDYFQRVYGVPTALILIDTYSVAAGFTTSGDDNDTTATQRAFSALRFVHKHTGAVVVVVDHFGKMVESGTRGSSNKEGNADAVLAMLADRELNGTITNPRLAVRKQRDGMSGFEIPFTPRVIDMGLDEDGDPVTAVVLDWGEPRRAAHAARKNKNMDALCAALMKTIKKNGFAYQVDGKGTVQACYSDDLQKTFFAHRPAKQGATPDAGRVAYGRFLKKAAERGLIDTRDNNGQLIVWRKV